MKSDEDIHLGHQMIIKEFNKLMRDEKVGKGKVKFMRFERLSDEDTSSIRETCPICWNESVACVCMEEDAQSS
jgi:hypothetical protein